MSPTNWSERVIVNRSGWLCWALASLAVGGFSGANADPQDLAQLDLKSLMNMDVKVTSVSKREQNLTDAASAITVLTNEDLRRSGATSIAEALRLVPGMDVAQINSSTWAVSARGFDEVFSRSLLVLVDGRAAFSPYNGSVYWDLQLQSLEDIERIEVIRGQGGTLWGANAVNGVVNIVTYSARDTQGALVASTDGDVHSTQDAVRYGGKIDNDTFYRAFSNFQLNDNYVSPEGAAVPDRWHGEQAGFRIDRYSDAVTHATLQGDYTRDSVLNDTQTNSDINIIGRWTRTLTERSSVEGQVYFDRLDIDDPTTYESIVDTFDGSVQHTLALGKRNDFIWGADFRFNHIILNPRNDPTQVRDGSFTGQLYGFFIQDECTLMPNRLILTVGSKVDYNSLTRVELQPNIRMMFKPSTQQSLWAAISRAIITPTYKQGVDAARTPGGPPENGIYPSFIGNPSIQASDVTSYELGYRIAPATRVRVELAAYASQYQSLINQVPTGETLPGPPGSIGVIEWENSYNARTYGGELNVVVTPIDRWKLTADYAFSHVHAYGLLTDPDAIDGSPRNQYAVRSALDVSKRTTLDWQFRYVSPVAGANAYLTGDVRFAFKPTQKIDLSIVGQNLFRPEHVELGEAQGLVARIPRGIYGKIVWRIGAM